MEKLPLDYRDLYDIREQFFEGGHFDIIDDAVQFRDILTQEPLLPGFIPESVHCHFADGFNHLKRMGAANRLHVQLVLGSHGSAAHFEAILKEQGSLLEQAQNIGIEASWRWRDKTVNREKILPRDVRAVAVESEQAPGRHEFQMTQLQWLWSNNKTILPLQPEVAESSELINAMTKTWGIYESATADRSLEPGTRNATRMIAERSYQAHRQWMLPGQLGTWLMHLDEQGELDDRNNTIPVILGRWHELSWRRLAGLGVRADASKVVSDAFLDTPEYLQYGQMIMKSTFNASIDMDGLRTKLPH